MGALDEVGARRQGKRVVELGCGCGLVGLVFAGLGAHALLTDLAAPQARPCTPTESQHPSQRWRGADLALRLAGEAERQGWRMRQATSQATPLPRQRAARARCMLCMCGTGGAADCWHKARPLRLCWHSYRVSACSQAHLT